MTGKAFRGENHLKDVARVNGPKGKCVSAMSVKVCEIIQLLQSPVSNVGCRCRDMRVKRNLLAPAMVG